MEIKICLVKNGYPPQYSPEVFSKVMEQVENFEENVDYSLGNMVVEYKNKKYDSSEIYGELKVAEESN